jgi:hypothetical protein
MACYDKSMNSISFLFYSLILMIVEHHSMYEHVKGCPSIQLREAVALTFQILSFKINLLFIINTEYKKYNNGDNK